MALWLVGKRVLSLPHLFLVNRIHPHWLMHPLPTPGFGLPAWTRLDTWTITHAAAFDTGGRSWEVGLEKSWEMSRTSPTHYNTPRKAARAERTCKGVGLSSCKRAFNNGVMGGYCGSLFQPPGIPAGSRGACRYHSGEAEKEAATLCCWKVK